MQIIPNGANPNESSFITKLAIEMMADQNNVYDGVDSFSPFKTEKHTIQVKRLGLLKTPSNIDPSYWVTPETAKKMQQF